MADFQTIEAPLSGVFRIAYRTPGPFVPADWSRAARHGTFSGRFDDPRADLPEHQRFRVLYCASDKEAAFGETLAGFRLPVGLAGRLGTVDDDEPIRDAYRFATDPEDHTRGLIEAEWRLNRAIGHTILERDRPFVDLASARTLQQLRASYGLWASEARVQDIDLGVVMGPRRQITQRISRYIYEQHDERGAPLFSGMRSISRHDQDWECWAIFADRIRHIPGMPGIPATIFPDDPDLLTVASVFRLTIEIMADAGRYYRP